MTDRLWSEGELDAWWSEQMSGHERATVQYNLDDRYPPGNEGWWQARSEEEKHQIRLEVEPWLALLAGYDWTNFGRKMRRDAALANVGRGHDTS